MSDYVIVAKKLSDKSDIKDVVALVKSMLTKVGYVKAKSMLLAQYDLEITIQSKDTIK